MSDPHHGLSAWHRAAARVRVPLSVAGGITVVTVAIVDAPPAAGLAALAVLAIGLLLYSRLGTPRGDTVDMASPVAGRWRTVNSPTSKVPSHGLNAWGQTHAVDLVFEPEDGSRPSFGSPPITRPPEDFPAFGQPILAPVGGEVVRAVGSMRDHRSRTSALGLAYFVAESVREIIGPPGVLGNHLVIRTDDGAHVALAHLRRHSLRADVGDRVRPGEVIAECGNSGNSTEPHLHIQAMDLASVWVAAGLPFTVDGRPLPENGEFLEPTTEDVGGG